MRSFDFFDQLFPEAKGWEKLETVWNARPRESNAKVLEGVNEIRSAFSPPAVEHLNKMFGLLEGDLEAQATLARMITFTQMKNDVAGF